MKTLQRMYLCTRNRCVLHMQWKHYKGCTYVHETGVFYICNENITKDVPMYTKQVCFTYAMKTLQRMYLCTRNRCVLHMQWKHYKGCTYVHETGVFYICNENITKDVPMYTKQVCFTYAMKTLQRMYLCTRNRCVLHMQWKHYKGCTCVHETGVFYICNENITKDVPVYTKQVCFTYAMKTLQRMYLCTRNRCVLHMQWKHYKGCTYVHETGVFYICNENITKDVPMYTKQVCFTYAMKTLQRMYLCTRNRCVLHMQWKHYKGCTYVHETGVFYICNEKPKRILIGYIE